MREPQLKQFYRENVVPELRKSRDYKNIHDVPKITKVVINTCVGTSLERGAVDDAVREVTNITGQKPIVTKARMSISNFKLREGMPLGAKVTLRGASMYEFLQRLISVALPGIRDFRGVSSKLDGQGNYNLGIEDHTIFPEVSVDSQKRNVGLDIAIVTSATSDDEGRELLKLMGMPFRRRESTTQTETADGAGQEAETAEAK